MSANQTTLEVLVDVIDYRKVGVGIEATVKAFYKGNEIHRHKFVISDARQRDKFLDQAVERANVTPEQGKKLRADLDEQIRFDEDLIRKTLEKNPEQQDQSAELPEDEREKALTFLRDPELLVRIQTDLGRMGAVGQERQKVLLYLIATSRKMQTGLAAVIKASSSAGKNHLVRTVATLMPEEETRDLSYISAKALYHVPKDWAKHKLVIIDEAVGKDQAEYAIRVFQSENRLRAVFTDRDRDSGPLTVRETEVEGPIAYLETTTRFELNHENATRVFEIYLDETENQTREILRQQALEDTEAGFMIHAERKEIQGLHRSAQRLLQMDLDVRVPFSPLIQFPPQHVRARRDRPKLIALTKLVAFIHQYQREIKEGPNGERYIDAIPFDYELAFAIAKDTFAETLDDLDKRSRGLLESAVQMVKVRKASPPSGPEGISIDPELFTRDDLAGWTGKKKHHLSECFQELEKKEYFLDANGEPIINRSTEKRVYRINWALVDRESSVEALTTPEQLQESLDQPASSPNLSVGQVNRESGNGSINTTENQPVTGLSNLSNLSSPPGGENDST